VEWSFDYLYRRWTDPDDENPSYWLHTLAKLNSASDVLEYFRGCDGHSTANPCTLDETPVYAFWDQVDIDVDGVSVPVVDLVYFTYYPYNRGKEIAEYGTFGHHVGDWEHATVRLTQQYTDGGWSLKPSQVYLAYHESGWTLSWEALAKVGEVGEEWRVWLPLIVAGDSAQSPLSTPEHRDSALPAGAAAVSASQPTHPVVFAAWGSHGLYPGPGRFCYKNIEVQWLCDDMGYGKAWDTWRLVEAYDFDNEVGLGSKAWPVWMGVDYGNHTDDQLPAGSGPIRRWGNPEDGCNVYFFGQACLLEDGPTGPIEKDVWDSSILR
jgi:hypothetical protein